MAGRSRLSAGSFGSMTLANRLDGNMCTKSDSYGSVGDTPVSPQAEQGVSEARMGT